MVHVIYVHCSKEKQYYTHIISKYWVRYDKISKPNTMYIDRQIKSQHPIISKYNILSFLVRSMAMTQDPKLEVPTIYKAYVSGLNFREYPQKIWPNIWY